MNPESQVGARGGPDPVPGCTHGLPVSGPEHRGTVPMATALPGFLTSVRFSGKMISEKSLQIHQGLTLLYQDQLGYLVPLSGKLQRG
ncbi:hypothetical protein E5288_WYG009308 [Bos mutus]|uniref:Uncharacterized protein n=1 Tax=Bos mutus TaxID=72004 RepID=A0A6B0RZY6_9CETA|nr:hypothetical protein [Bos mutus]